MQKNFKRMCARTQTLSLSSHTKIKSMQRGVISFPDMVQLTDLHINGADSLTELCLVKLKQV
jgi:hypothetical protein